MAEPIKSDEELLRAISMESGRSNVVRAENRKDGRIRIRTNLQVNRIKGETVIPENVADAYASCTECQSFAVAIQINVYERGASVIAPRNTARAVNDNCSRCVTIARAYQYVIPVDDLDFLPDEVDRLVRAINKEAHYFDQIKDTEDVNPAEIQARLNAVLGQFAQLDIYLEAAMAEETEQSGETRAGAETAETATPTLTPTADAATPTPTPTATAQAAASEAASPATTPTPASTPEGSATP
jgi:putative peptide zinc metalloprotease protein